MIPGRQTLSKQSEWETDEGQAKGRGRQEPLAPISLLQRKKKNTTNILYTSTDDMWILISHNMQGQLTNQDSQADCWWAGLCSPLFWDGWVGKNSSDNYFIFSNYLHSSNSIIVNQMNSIIWAISHRGVGGRCCQICYVNRRVYQKTDPSCSWERGNVDEILCYQLRLQG